MIKLKDIIESIDNQLPISKKEEDYALYYINRKLIPDVLEDYNKLLQKHPNYPPRDYPRIGYNTIRKYLKKLSREPFGITYESKLTDDVSIRFRVIKQFEYNTKFLITAEIQFGGIHRPITHSVDLSGVNALLEEHFTLDRREEGEGLQFIRRYMIPTFVKQWNDRTVYEITEKQVLDALRKVDERRPPQYINVHSNDSIYYTATLPIESYNFPEGLKIKFTLTKDGDDMLIVGFESPLISGEWYYVRPPHKRITESLQEWTGDTFLISKKEEDWALHKVKEIWGHVYGPHFNRNLKKVRHEKMDTSDQIDYWSEREDGLEFLLMIRKTHEGLQIARSIKRGNDEWVRTSDWINIMTAEPKQKLAEVGGEDYRLSKEDEQYAVTYLLRRLLPQIVQEKYTHFLEKHPGMYKPSKYLRITPSDVAKRFRKIRFDVDSARYESIINDDIDFAFEIRKEITTQGPRLVVGAQGPLNVDWSWYPVKYDLQEAKKPVIAKTYPISKMEEEEALQFIRRTLIPQAVHEWNTMITPRPEYTVHEVSRNLRKVRREVPNKSTILAIVVYESKIRTTEFVFKIAKSADGRLVAGRGRDPQTWYDLYNNKIKLEETFNPNDPNRYAVSKMEEDYALELIKRKLIPQIVDMVNETRKLYTGGKDVSYMEARRTLKKVGHTKQHPRLRDNIIYQIKIEGEAQPFKFNIYKNSEGKLIVNNVADGTSHFIKM